MAQRFAHPLQPIEHAYCRQHMGGVGTLPPARLEETLLTAVGQQGVEEEVFVLPFHQTGTKLAQHGMIEARIGQIQT